MKLNFHDILKKVNYECLNDGEIVTGDLTEEEWRIYTTKIRKLKKHVYKLDTGKYYVTRRKCDNSKG